MLRLAFSSRFTLEHALTPRPSSYIRRLFAWPLVCALGFPTWSRETDRYWGRGPRISLRRVGQEGLQKCSAACKRAKWKCTQFLVPQKVCAWCHWKGPLARWPCFLLSMVPCLPVLHLCFPYAFLMSALACRWCAQSYTWV